MNGKKSRLAGISAIAVLVSYLLPWSFSWAVPVIFGMWEAFRDGYFFTGIWPAFELLRFVVILGLVGYVTYSGLLKSYCQWYYAAALGSLSLLDNIIYAMNGAEAFGLGIGLNYLSSLCLVGLSIWGARDSTANHPNEARVSVGAAVSGGPFSNNVLPGVAALLLLASMLMPWANFNRMSTTLADVGMEIFRKGNLDRAPTELVIALLAFILTVGLAALVVYQAFVLKAPPKRMTLALGLLGLAITATASFRISRGLNQFGGMVDVSDVFKIVGLGVYVFLICSVWLVWMGALSQPIRRTTQ